MNHLKLLLVFSVLLIGQTGKAQPVDTKLYELRIYYCESNKLENLISRFQNHTLKLFEKHGMQNVGYWVPLHNEKNTLYYIIAFPGKTERENSWNSFRNDPEWIKARDKSEADGKIVLRVESILMTAAEYTMRIKPSQSKDERVFELRTYYCYPGKLADINKRFKNFTIRSFEKHGMKNIAYWNTAEASDTIQSKLVYLLAHKSEEAANDSFSSFDKDPERKKVFDASEANGEIIEKIESVFLKALPFSKIK